MYMTIPGHIQRLSVCETKDTSDCGIEFEMYTIAQLLTDMGMTISFTFVAITCLDQLVLLINSDNNNSELLYNQTVGNEKKGFLHFLLRMPFKQPLLALFIVLIGIVVTILLFVVPPESREAVVTAEHITMSSLVFIAYLTLFIVSIAISVILSNTHSQSVVFVQQLRSRILGLCLTASIVGILRFPFDMCVANGIFVISRSPVLFIGLALIFRFVPYTLISVLMWPLPSAKATKASQQQSANTLTVMA